ncbi:UNVERIFIED_CONTAM: hypothetical protein Slati_0423100 [Sesamum latifolium]|uniref:Gag-pol polyprotein n=1 Tax=Sesamum latifolium TaxID=2727402 RepID=A0AAW2XVF2_9LAMI
MAVEGKSILSKPRSYKDGPQRPKSDKFCRFHNDCGHTTEECRHLNNEIKWLIQNNYLQEYICWEKARGTGSYQKYKTDKDKNVKNPSPESSVKDMPRSSMTENAEVNDPPRKCVIRMIVGGPAGGDSQRARKAQVREAYVTLVREVMEVEPANDAPLIQFDQEEPRGPRTPGNDALVITALLASYEIERVFINSGEVVHPRGRQTLNAFRAIISTYHIKIKFPVIGGVGEAQARKCYVEAIKREKKRGLEETPGEENSKKWGKDLVPNLEPKEEAPVTVQPVEELLTVELIPGDPGKVTKIGSRMKEDVRDQVVNYLRKNKDIFAWTAQELEGIDPGVITHHLNLDPRVRPVKQKKRHFGPEKDKIIQEEVNKLLTAGHIKEIQFPEWLPNVVLVPKPSGKWRMCIDFRNINKVCPKDFYPLPRIDQWCIPHLDVNS